MASVKIIGSQRDFFSCKKPHIFVSAETQLHMGVYKNILNIWDILELFYIAVWKTTGGVSTELSNISLGGTIYPIQCIAVFQLKQKMEAFW